jgi:hypothetical protein
MSEKVSVRGLLIAVVILSFAAFPARIQAETVYAYDLDSLVHLSTDVAEVEITRRYKANELELIDVKVTLVHKGGFKKGQSIVVLGADSYRGFEQAAGTRLVLFLEPLREVHGAVIPRTRLSTTRCRGA